MAQRSTKAKTTLPLVAIVMGSKSDLETMRHAAQTLKKLKIPHDVSIHSAHRTPDRLKAYIENMEAGGVKVVIAGAGMAAALPGAIAALTPLPVLGVPMEGRVMGGPKPAWDPEKRRSMCWPLGAVNAFVSFSACTP